MKYISIQLLLVVVVFVVLISFVHDVDLGTADNVEFNESIDSANSTIYIPYLAVSSVIFNGDFEKGPVGWGQYSEQGWPLIITAADLLVPPHSGNWAVWLGGDDDEIAAIWQTVNVPDGSQTLRFWYWIASEDACGYDVAGVTINLDEVVDAFWLCTASNTGGWVQRSIDLSDYAGQTVEIDILVGTDEILNSNLFVDDVSLGNVGTNSGLSNELGDPELDISVLSPKEAANQESINQQETTFEDYRLDSILQEMQTMLLGSKGK